MIKKCNVCGHTGELTWRDGKYHCAACDSEISETEPAVQKSTVVNNATCPICKNRENNLFDGNRYRCALCGTDFDMYQAAETQTNTTVSNNGDIAQKAVDGFKKKDPNLILGIIFIFLFWPLAIYFFYKFYQSTKGNR